MPVQGHAPRGSRENPFLAADRGPGVRRKPTLLAEARGFFRSGSAYRMDGQDWIESNGLPVSLLTHHVPLCCADSINHLAVALQMVAPAAPIGRLDLPETPRAPAKTRTTGKDEGRRSKDDGMTKSEATITAWLPSNLERLGGCFGCSGFGVLSSFA